jgi:hypothetical protein
MVGVLRSGLSREGQVGMIQEVPKTFVVPVCKEINYTL